jgi:hypothetical protein
MADDQINPRHEAVARAWCAVNNLPFPTEWALSWARGFIAMHDAAMMIHIPIVDATFATGTFKDQNETAPPAEFTVTGLESLKSVSVENAGGSEYGPNTPEMAERVAKAMYAVIPDPKPTWEEAHYGQRAFFRTYAAAGIAAMREPTGAMIRAALDPPSRTDMATHAIRQGVALPMQEDLGVVPTYQRMIDAAGRE